MPTDPVARFVALAEKGFEAVGCRMPVVADGATASVRDVFVEFRTSIECFRASDPERPFMSFPINALESAASAVCVAVISGVVARAVEADA